MMRRYMTVRGELLADPAFTLDAVGRELVRLRVGVRMPGGPVEPVRVEGGDIMPAYCRAKRLEQSSLIVASGWAQYDADPDGTVRGRDAGMPLLRADMIAADTSMSWSPSP